MPGFRLFIVKGGKSRYTTGMQHPVDQPPRKQTGVPRRFGVGVMLVITTMYALLFALLSGLGFPPLAFVTIALFFTGVGLGQAFLYKGRDPRKASIVAGLVLTPLALIVVGIDTGSDPAGFLVLYIFSGLGALPGYLAGGLIAGVFLFLNKVQPPLDDPADENPAEETKIPDRPAAQAAAGPPS